MLKQNENKNENTTTQNLWDTGKNVPGGMFHSIVKGKLIALENYLKKQEKSSKR